MKEITAKELKEKIEAGEYITLIDVREPYEHEEFNIGGILIPLAEIQFSTDRIRETGGKEIVLYCRSGNRSGLAVKILAAAGIMNAVNLKGGVIAWKEEVSG